MGDVDVIKLTVRYSGDPRLAVATQERRAGHLQPRDERAAVHGGRGMARKVLRVHPKLVGVGGRCKGADLFVIGPATARNGTGVTEEAPSGRLEKPRILDVCEALGIPWRTLVGVARDEGWTFNHASQQVSTPLTSPDAVAPGLPRLTDFDDWR